MSRVPLPETFELRGLETAPSQLWESVRLVPVLRRQAPGDLRLGLRRYDEDLTVVHLGGRPEGAAEAYISYVPHGLVATWGERGEPAAVFGGRLGTRQDGKRFDGPFGSVRLAHRMVKREAEDRLRLLPLHLAMEGFLALHFGGPDVAWSEYSRQALSRGLSPRSERTFQGEWIPGLEDALRVFEIHEDQVGVLLFVAGALGSAFVVSHPEDYRRLHRTLIEDFYGELLMLYGLTGSDGEMSCALEDEGIESLADLRAGLSRMRQDWASFQVMMAQGLLGRRVRSKRVYNAGPFTLYRFMTNLDPAEENHIGEAILRRDGTLEYLKTFRLSAAQTRRAYLLSRLADHSWDLRATATALKQSTADLILRLDKAGFGYLLKEHVLQEAQSRKRRRRP